MKVFLIDTNVLLADVLEFHVHHTLARQWFLKQESDTIFYLPRVVQISFMKLLTSESVFQNCGWTDTLQDLQLKIPWF